jgi:hypothetical protein
MSVSSSIGSSGAVVVVGGVEHKIKAASAAQIAGIAKILSQVGIESKRAMSGVDDGDYLTIIAALIGAITEEQLISLAALCIGVDRQYASDNFDMLWVTEALAVLMEETDLAGVIKNFTRIASRFRS